MYIYMYKWPGKAIGETPTQKKNSSKILLKVPNLKLAFQETIYRNVDVLVLFKALIMIKIVFQSR